MALPWLVPLLYAAVHALFPPRSFNTHAIMYALVAQTGAFNVLQLFHPLYTPALRAVDFIWAALGLAGPALPALQALSLAAAVLELRLIHRAARAVLGDERQALLAAALATASINLWAWSLQTTAYTLAGALTLACLCLLIEEPRPAPRRAALLGLLTGAAAGFDTAALVLAPVVLAELGLDKTGPRARRAAAYAAALAGTLALAYVPLGLELAAAGAGPRPLPADIVSLAASRSLLAQLKGLAASTAPVDVPYWLLALFHAWLLISFREAKRSRLARAVRIGASFFALHLAFFLLCDPHNRYLYACGLLVPVMALAALRRLRASPYWALALWALLLGRNAAVPADYAGHGNAGFDEARYVRGQLGAKDLLVCLSSPDWLFAYAVAGRLPMVQVDWPGDARADFGQAFAPAGPGLNSRIRAALCGGGRVLLASDSLFRSSVLAKGELDRDQDRLLRSLAPDFVLGPALVSPGGLYYYPVLLGAKAFCYSP